LREIKLKKVYNEDKNVFKEKFGEEYPLNSPIGNLTVGLKNALARNGWASWTNTAKQPSSLELSRTSGPDWCGLVGADRTCLAKETTLSENAIT
jgi:hypothetical protein